MHSSRMRTARLRVVLGGGEGADVQTWSQGGVDVQTWSQGGGGGRCSDLVTGGEGVDVQTWSQGGGGRG